MIRRGCATLSTLLLGFALHGFAQTRNYTIFDEGYEATFYGINDRGDTVGLSRRVAGEDRGLLVSNGTAIDYQYPGSTNTTFQGINNRGEIVGTSVIFANATVERRMFVFRNGAFAPLPPLPAGYLPLVASGINNLGDIVGTAFNLASAGQFTGFLLRGGKYTFIDVPGAASTFASGINEKGDIVGYYQAASGSGNRGFLLSNGQYSWLDMPGVTETTPIGLNNQGGVVGGYFVRDNQQRVIDAGGFYLKNGVFTKVRLPRTNQNALYGINERGEAAGIYRSASSLLGISEGYVAMVALMGR